MSDEKSFLLWDREEETRENEKCLMVSQIIGHRSKWMPRDDIMRGFYWLTHHFHCNCQAKWWIERNEHHLKKIITELVTTLHLLLCHLIGFRSITNQFDTIISHHANLSCAACVQPAKLICNSTGFLVSFLCCWCRFWFIESNRFDNA